MAKKPDSFADILSGSVPNPKRPGIPSWFDKAGPAQDELREFKRRWKAGEFEEWQITELYEKAKARFKFPNTRCTFANWLKRD